MDVGCLVECRGYSEWRTQSVVAWSMAGLMSVGGFNGYRTVSGGLCE